MGNQGSGEVGEISSFRKVICFNQLSAQAFNTVSVQAVQAAYKYFEHAFSSSWELSLWSSSEGSLGGQMSAQQVTSEEILSSSSGGEAISARLS